jgi:CheY-like chemotaxis protein
MARISSRMLIVDDDVSVREMFAWMLRDDGYAVRTAGSAAAALDAVAEWQPHAILLDYRMPGMNGLGLLSCLRAQESTSRTPVAIITGDSDDGGFLSAECAKLGAKVYFKPLGLEELLDVACSLLPSSKTTIRH